MRSTLICVLGLFLMNTLCYGQYEARKRNITLTADRKTIKEQSVTLTCNVEDSAGWKYQWFRKNSTGSGKTLQTADDGESDRLSISQGGIYTCRGRRSEPDAFTPESNAVIINETVPDKAVLSLQPNWPEIYRGETVTIRCEIQGGGDTKWTYQWRPDNLHTSPTPSEHKISSTDYYSGGYSCRGLKDSYSLTEWSNVFRLTVSSNKPKAKLRADNRDIPVGGSVTLTCSVDSSSSGWKYYWYRGEKTSEPLTTQDAVLQSNGQISVSQGGSYWCRGGRGDPVYHTEYSDYIRINKIVPNKAVVTLQPNWPEIYRGETVTIRCEIQGGGDTKWTYDWRPDNLKTPTLHEHKISSSGGYSCRGLKDSYSFTEWSNVIRLTVSLNKPKPTLTADKTITPVGGSVTLTCSVDDSADWKYDWFRQTSESSAPQLIRNFNPNRVISVYQGGIYYCRGGRGDSVFYTENSNKVTIQETVSNKAVVTLQPNWPLIYSGETITVRCEIEGGGNTRWEYEWRPANLNTSPTLSEYKIIRASVSHSGDYRCKGRKDSYSSTEWSDVFTLTVSSNKPKPKLRADNRDIPVGGSVTLTCSVDSSSSGWKYYWYGGEKTSEPLTRQDAVLQSNRKIRVSKGGPYWCRGGRGDPVYLTEYSDSININNIVPNKAVVTLQPNWTEIYRGETIMLRCEIHDGDTEWEYEWKRSPYTSTNKNEYMISKASSYHSGNYRCRGRKMKNAERFLTEWSAYIKLTVSDNPPAADLTVSPLWLSPGDSVTLSCEVEHPSAGWRFYWYKTIPKLSDNSYIYELLPGSINGTEQDSYIIHGPTHTAGYMCTAGRGDPVYYTRYSKPGFVWSGDVHSAVTLKVSPDRVQHFTSDSVSLSCEGNFTEWRVRRFPEDQNWSDCYNWRSMTGSTCNIYSYQQSDEVYWCESGSGEFSNAVNITIQNADIILVSPVHPVTEGQSVTLGCKLRRGELLSVSFYQNDKLIQIDTRRELKISAVSKSDEGFYKCKYSGEESAQSWMSVQAVSRPENSSSLIPLIFGLVCGVVLIILLILLYLYRRSKGSLFIRPIQPESTNQNETQRNENSSSLHDADESQNVTYSLIELKNFAKTGKRQITVESSVYAEVKTGSAADDGLTYAQVNHDIKGKAKKHKGKSAPAATDEAVYSEVKPGTAHATDEAVYSKVERVLDDGPTYAQVNRHNKGKAKKHKGR
ncbi:Fc receptor-like protein 5 [Scomber scombrus]|uniref:Fc receptor-like protein 5 n=1 Tax=Scomber scombrus TaxID=13677 RepID=UPI002DDAF4EF|nr:Fc receptor-like protein 5 [Scomber scombrus]